MYKEFGKRKVTVIMSYELFVLRKNFEPSKFLFPPQKGARLTEPIDDGKSFVTVQISEITQWLGNDNFVVECVVQLDKFCQLYLFGKNWEFMSNLDAFLDIKKVRKMNQYLKTDGMKFHSEVAGKFGVPS